MLAVRVSSLEVDMVSHPLVPPMGVDQFQELHESSRALKTFLIHDISGCLSPVMKWFLPDRGPCCEPSKLSLSGTWASSALWCHSCYFVLHKCPWAVGKQLHRRV